MFAKPAGTPGGGENSHQGRLQTATNADGGPLVRRAVDLFEFLARAQQLKADPPRTTDAYERDGKVLWLSDLPVHNAVHAAHHVPTPDPDDPILVIDRVPRVDSPQVPEELVPWVVGDVDDPDKQLLLRESAYLASSQQERHDPADSLEAPEHSLVFLADRPDLAEAFDEWFQAWSFWADREREDRSTRAIYRELFSAYVKATSQPEEFELIVGVGSLAWRPGGHSPLRRHVLTAPATITFHDDTGQIAVSREVASDGLRVELDMVEPDLIRNPGHVSDFRARAASFEAHPLDRVRVEELMHRFVNSLDADGQYVDADSQPNWAPTANAAFAPAVILRRRSQVGLVEVFTTIARQIAEAGQVPSGLLPLLDPDHTPTVDPEPIEGAVVVVDDDVFLPMPLNDVQLRIVRRVESHAQTLVQGPPGTGKTHTAAALITHLLAQGKRVLVTAHTDRALKEVRGKLPESIKPLSVAIVGAARDDLTDLKVAVERIAAMSVEHDHVAAEQQIGRHLESIDGFRRQRAERYRRLLEARSNEVSSHSHAGREGTLAAIAQQYLAEADRYGWLAEYVIPGQDLEVPLSDAEAIEWLSYLRDRALANDLEEASRRLIPFDQMPSASVFATLIDHERATSEATRLNASLIDHDAFDTIRLMPQAERADLQARMRALAQRAEELEMRHESWMSQALFDIRSGRGDTWRSRADSIIGLLVAARPHVNSLGATTEVSVSGHNRGSLSALARHLREHVAGSGPVKTAADGSPHIGPFTSKSIKQAKALFDRVLVDGLPPTTLAQLNHFLAFDEADRQLAALDRAWPTGVEVPAEDTLRERLVWHETELQQLLHVLALAESLAQEEQRLAEAGLARPDWNNLQAVLTYARLVDAAAAQEAWLAATQPVERLASVIASVHQWSDAAPSVHRLALAVAGRDRDEYAVAHTRLTRLFEVRRLASRRDELGDRLAQAAPNLAAAVQQDPDSARWDGLLSAFDAAWGWVRTGVWILKQDTTDVNMLQAQIAAIETRLRGEEEGLAATRAWSHAVSPGRLTGQARADLTQYAQLVKR